MRPPARDPVIQARHEYTWRIGRLRTGSSRVGRTGSSEAGSDRHPLPPVLLSPCKVHCRCEFSHSAKRHVWSTDSALPHCAACESYAVSWQHRKLAWPMTHGTARSRYVGDVDFPTVAILLVPAQQTTNSLGSLCETTRHAFSLEVHSHARSPVAALQLPEPPLVTPGTCSLHECVPARVATRQ